MNLLLVDEIIKRGLIEDNYYRDITSEAILKEDKKVSVDLLAKEEGILAGLEVFSRVFTFLGDVKVDFYKKDGDFIRDGEKIGRLSGSASKILTGERLALNLLQRMSGIASFSHKASEEIRHTKAKILDTRKTAPGLSVLDKYAVKVGGGYNHRFNLSEGFMIKDNHIAAAGSISEAVQRVRDFGSFGKMIEVETENLDQVREALEAGADIIMLDNMGLDEMEKAVELIGNKALSEASGNINLENIRSVAETGVDYISLGALTHSVKALDLSMKNLTYK